MASQSELEKLLEAISSWRQRLVAVVVHLNDTYLIEERPDQELPGFPRVIATVGRIREHVRETHGEDRTVVVHSGDFLGPSRVGTRTRGAAMVELLNRMGLAYYTLGNHEFDYGEETLVERPREAKFELLLANVTSPTIAAQRWALWPRGPSRSSPSRGLSRNRCPGASGRTGLSRPRPSPFKSSSARP